MNRIAISDVMQRLRRDLPSLPVVVIDVLESFEQQEPDIAALAGKISRDQALAAKTLRIANSSFYGLSHKVSTISQAITVLGFDNVRSIVAAAFVIDCFSNPGHASFDFPAFWRHAIGSALCAKMLAQRRGLNQNFAFISGLLHDIGKLVLVTYFPEQYAAVIGHRAASDCYMLDAEREVLGIDHAMVGRALAERWKFPSPMQRAIANHHQPERADLGDIAALVHVADAIAHALDLTRIEDDLVPVLREDAWHSLELDQAGFNDVCRAAEAEFENACRILVK